ncbi:MAG TPA: hypothetical protein VEQ59_21780 [Polyangiaceae bacterium]|nr:hypothetical protein [Polyangiaceae bacterium]
MACSGRTEHGGFNEQSDAQGAPAPASTASARAARSGHLLLVVELEPALRAAKVLLTRSVALPLPRRRGPAQAAPWRVEVLDDTGAVAFSAPLADASALRAEFQDEHSAELHGAPAQKRVAAVTLRLPWLDGARQVRIIDARAGNIELARVAYPQVQP